jgi:D-alanyl-D-alanine carboxypeptidase
VLLLGLLLLYPGQNQWQKLDVSSTSDNRIKGVSIDLGAEIIPVANGLEPPQLTATAAVVFDPVSGTILYQKNPDEPLPPASTTKIMTALVAMEIYLPETVLAIISAPQATGSSMKLQPGEKMSVHNLLLGMMVGSANDAALTLAEHYPGGYEAFIDRMNEKAAELNLRSTHFSNVSGIGTANHYSSVHDLVILAKEAFRSPYFRELVSTKEVVVSDVTGGHQYHLMTTNKLLGMVEGVSGVKTGWTSEAGECLVTFAERDGRQIFTALLGSTDRFGESRDLIEWAYAGHTWEKFE